MMTSNFVGKVALCSKLLVHFLIAKFREGCDIFENWSDDVVANRFCAIDWCGRRFSSGR
jgi:hypothetical protein